MFLFNVYLLVYGQDTTGYFQIGTRRWPLLFSEVANESHGINSKWEIDLTNDDKNVSRAKTFIYFSLTGNNITRLTEGMYEFTSSTTRARSPFWFYGEVSIDEQKINITGGSLSLEKEKEGIKVHFVLSLENGNVVTGQYSGKTFEADRTDRSKIPFQIRMPDNYYKQTEK